MLEHTLGRIYILSLYNAFLKSGVTDIEFSRIQSG